HISWLGAIPFALLMFRNFTFMHEAAHGLAHSNKKLNYLFGMVAGTICFLPYQPWKAIHLDHHVWTGNFEKDPVLEVVKKYPASSRIMKGVFTAMWRTRFPLMAFFQYIVLWGHSAARLLKNTKDIHFWLSFLMPCTA